MEERGHSLESILASIEARKPDFDAYIAPQKEFADLIIEVLPTDLDPEDKKTLRFVASKRKVLLTTILASSLIKDQPLHGLLRLTSLPHQHLESRWPLDHPSTTGRMFRL